MKNRNYENLIMTIFFIFVVIVPLGFIIMTLWNNILIPALQEGAIYPIGFWQAIGILLLFRLLFGGIPTDWFEKKETRKQLQDQQLLDKWMRMTAEEKE